MYKSCKSLMDVITFFVIRKHYYFRSLNDLIILNKGSGAKIENKSFLFLYETLQKTLRYAFDKTKNGLEDFEEILSTKEFIQIFLSIFYGQDITNSKSAETILIKNVCVYAHTRSITKQIKLIDNINFYNFLHTYKFSYILSI